MFWVVWWLFWLIRLLYWLVLRAGIYVSDLFPIALGGFPNHLVTKLLLNRPIWVRHLPIVCIEGSIELPRISPRIELRM